MKVYCYVVVEDRMCETVVCCVVGVVERMYKFVEGGLWFVDGVSYDCAANE